jgi:hypothetical protein
VEIGHAAGLPSGTVHPILARLEGVGWLESRWEEIDPRAEGRPARRYYRLTPDGLELARSALARAYGASARPACCDPRANSHDRPHRVPGDRPGGPAHLVGELGGPLRRPAPPAGHRSRYRQEFLAELYGMSPAEQLHHASGVLFARLDAPVGPDRARQAAAKGGRDGQARALPTPTPPLATPAQPPGWLALRMRQVRSPAGPGQHGTPQHHWSLTATVGVGPDG